jgi:hypothetical protein
VHHRDQLFLGQLEEAVARRRKSQHLEGPGHKTPLENPDFSNDRRGKKNKCRLPRLAEDTGSARVVFRGGTNQYFSIIGMLGTVPDSYLFQIPVIKYLLPPHTVLVIGPALDSVQNSRSVSNRFGG